MPLGYILWLMPAEPLRSQLYKVVRDLAQEFSASQFDPHVTLYLGPSTEEEIKSVAEKVASRISPVELEMLKLDQSTLYSKTFFIQFHESEDAQRIYEMARANVAAPSSYVLNPHLSLLYQNLDEGQRQELCRRSIVPGGRYAFDEVWAIEFESPWTEKSAKEYRVLAKQKLKPVS